MENTLKPFWLKRLLLCPDWLKLCMIRSSVDALVDTALKDLEPGQLILFIQSFGIPVSSMYKMLQALDRMNAFVEVDMDMDKAYTQQLLQVHKYEILFLFLYVKVSQ